MKLKHVSLVLLFSTLFVFSQEKKEPIEYSKAGFWDVENSGRKVFNFNNGWRFLKGDAIGAEQKEFDDSDWQVVNCPHGLEYIPSESTGGNNYQGIAWYRKHFKIDANITKKRLKLHFEAVMGKCKIWLNGNLIGEHFGGYLPFVVDLDKYLNKEGDNVLTVWADNSDDETYPPGKPQTGLDFTYFGGIYRDVWMVATNKVYVTNPMEVDKVAGGGVFTSISSLSKEEVFVKVAVDIQNDANYTRKIKVDLTLKDGEGNKVAFATKTISIKKLKSFQVHKTLTIKKPNLWSPWNPNLYRLEVVLNDNKGAKVDGVATRVGLRKIEFKGKDGLYLNNEAYPGKLMGANRHQDHGYVGYAIPNNGQYRDAKILKESASDVVRAGHYPPDPAFMDACDELGLFFIEATPGWQYWNNDNPIFEKRVYEDIRNMVRRDRNHPSVILWEPVLNESLNPNSFTINAHTYVHEEYPYQGAFTVCDRYVGGNEIYDVVYGHAENDISDTNRSVFQREYGSVGSTNSPNRMHRDWGEHALKFQAEHYAESFFEKGSIELIYKRPRQFVGGALWHSFDHYAGKHARPFYGGIADVFRQPKYSFFLYKSQRDVSETVAPFVYLAHELSPFSPKDVNVFTNCEEVRLTANDGLAIYQKKAKLSYITRANKRGRQWDNPSALKRKQTFKQNHMPHPIVKFENAYDYVASSKRYFTASGKSSNSGILVEGLIDGKVVASTYKRPAANGYQIKLKLVDRDVSLTANGADFVLVMAYIEDKKGNFVRFHENTLKFEVSGEGAIIGDASISANPIRMEWGTAPLLVRSTTKAGKIKIKASLLHPGPNTIKGGELEIESIASKDIYIQNEIGVEPTKKVSLK